MNNTCEKILTEMIKVRKMAMWSSVLSLIIMILVLIYGYYAIHKALTKEQSSKERATWSSIKSAYNSMEYDKGFELAKELTAKAPNYPHGYKWMAVFCLVKGDLESAEEYYQKAYDLWPDEEYKENIDLIRKAIENKKQNQRVELTR